MKKINLNNILESKNDIIYPIYENDMIDSSIIETLGYNINEIVDKSLNKITIIHTLGQYQFKKLIFIGLGKKEDMTTSLLRKVFSNINVKEKSLLLIDHIICHIDIDKITQIFVETYYVSQYKQPKINKKQNLITNIDIVSAYDINNSIELGYNIASGINYARELSDTPSNYMTPTTLVNEAIELANQYENLECTILNKEKLEEMGAGGILAVNQGSDIPCYMIVLKYTHDNSDYKAIVGKGLTFDSGGYSIKSNSVGMKYDMCGGADVLGIMKILASNKVKANVYGIIPTTENLVSDKAYKCDDVITTLSKQTVEIVSTDAEGRLILCDALTYAQSLNVSHIIDIATLTGACVRALGDVYTGVFSNDDEFYNTFNEAIKESDEKGWRLPIDDEYFKMLKSEVADFKNSAGKPLAGASVAANYLNAFINNSTKWIHLDVAGTADSNGKGATGAMIRTISYLLSKGSI